MINFVTKDDRSQQILSSIRRYVMVITSVILVVYIVIAGGILGWSTWQASQQKKTNEELDSLTSQVNKKFDVEVVVRNVADRAAMVDKFLTDRGNASDASFLIIRDGFNINRWEYTLGGYQTLEIAASSPASLKEYYDYSSGNYTKVQISQVQWNPETGWVGIFILTGRKQT